MVNPIDCVWLDGPGLVAWLEEVAGENFSSHHDSLSRRAYEWRRGASADVFAVDRYLLQIGLHLSQVPAELYREKRSMRREPGK